MNVLGMGPMELLLIIVLALIVFGPAKLPEIMGQVGKAIGDFRRATSELSDEFNRTIQAELNETKQTIAETKSALTDVQTTINSTVRETHAAVTSAPQRIAAPTVETNGYGETVANGTTTPPIADNTQWSWETSSASAQSETSAPTVESQTSSESASTEVAEGPPATSERVLPDELQPPY